MTLLWQGEERSFSQQIGIAEGKERTSRRWKWWDRGGHLGSAQWWLAQCKKFMWYTRFSDDQDVFYLRRDCSWAMFSCLFLWKVQGSIFCFGHFSSGLLLHLWLPCDCYNRSYVCKYSFNSCPVVLNFINWPDLQWSLWLQGLGKCWKLLQIS